MEHTAPLWPQANEEIERQNRSILKRLKIAQIEKQNWKEVLLEYLLMYRSSPHATTGVSPAELLFNRKIKTKLPELCSETLLDEEVRERDEWRKEKEKMYYDMRNRVKENALKPGDTVVLSQRKENKLSPEFDSTRYQVTDRRGNTVTVRSPAGNTFTRNVAKVKKFNIKDEIDSQPSVMVKAEVESDSEQDIVITNKTDSEVENASVPQVDPVEANRPRRPKKTPERFKDFVLE